MAASITMTRSARRVEDVAFGRRAFRESGILPEHAVRISDFAIEHGMYIAFRPSKLSGAFWIQRGWFRAKPPAIKAKTSNRLELAFGVDPEIPGWRKYLPWNMIYRPYYDLAVIISRKAEGMLEEGEVMEGLVRRLNPTIGNQITHPTWWTWSQAFEPPPGGMFVFTPSGGAFRVGADEWLGFAKQHGLPWEHIWRTRA